MLRNKIYWTILLLALLSVFVGLYFFSKDENKLISSKAEQESVQIDNSIEVSVVKSRKEVANQRQLEVLETQSQNYNEDPAVDSLIAINLFAECIKYFKPVKSIGIMQVTEKKYTPKQQKYLDKYHRHCEEVKRKQPQYFEKDIYTRILELNNKPVVNELGALISKVFKPFDTYDDIDIPKSIKLIKQSHPDVMILGYKLLGQKFKTEILLPEMKDYLNSYQSQYVESISEWGQLLYACNHGANCAENSGILIRLCQANEAFCVGNINDIIQSKMSHGQRNDISLAEQYFVNLYNLKNKE
jgi:hypothetical protein